MRTVVLVVWLLWLGTPAAIHAGDREKALAVIEQAIKAHGGAEELNKAQLRSRTGKGVILTPSGEVPVTTEEIVQLPDRCRVVMDLRSNRIIVVLRGAKGWIQPGGATQEMPKALFQERREDLYVWWLMNLTPLLKDEFTLLPLADDKVSGQDTSVVKVAHKEHAEVRLFFDKKSGLLVKIARRAAEAGDSLNKEIYLSEYKKFDGVMLPSKEVITHNGIKYAVVSFSSYKIEPRVEERTFEKP
jgi:hypothetical protein